MTATAMRVDERLLFDFEPEGRMGHWVIVNDGVMGGLSESNLVLTDQGTVIFGGLLSLENHGGFASVRTVPYRYALGGFAGLALRVRGDGRRYRLRMRAAKSLDGPAYEVEFDTVPDTWITVGLPFADAVPTFRGRLLQDMPPLRGEDILQVGLMIADKQGGPFRLEVDWVKAYRFASGVSARS
jgi:hypothetical protein